MPWSATNPIRSRRSTLISGRPTGWKALAEPGGICVSGRVQEDARGSIDIAFDDEGIRNYVSA